MRTGPGGQQVIPRIAGLESGEHATQALAGAGSRELPYDYAVSFALQGRRGNRSLGQIAIGNEGAFVATSIGYGFLPARLPVLTTQDDLTALRELTRQLGTIEVDPGALPKRAQPLFKSLVSVVDPILRKARSSAGGGAGNLNRLIGTISPYWNPLSALQCLNLACGGLRFRYALADSGSGREQTNQMILNTAGLGSPDGERPFRALPRPALFPARSTIRVEIEEISEGFAFGYDDDAGRRVTSELQIVLHGYKVIGGGA